ncbi:MAG: OmpA family protein [Saprospiraceae bacterium]
MIRKLNSSFCLLLVGFCVAIGQPYLGDNMVSNPGFESIKKGINGWSKTRQEFNKSVSAWISPTGGTPDLVSKDLALDFFYLSHNFGVDEAKEGKNMVGIISYGSSSICIDYREYISTTLLTALEPQKEYLVSFWFKPRFRSTYWCNGLGVAFLENLVIKEDCAPLGDLSPIFSMEEIPEVDVWLKVSFKFKPKKPFKYLVIGNFNTNENTGCIKKDSSGLGHAYYFIDDIRVSEILKEIPSSLEVKRHFSSFYFEFDAHILNEGEKVKLISVFNYLEKNPGLNLKLKGYCDEVGNEDFNLKLSLKRAESIRDSLIQMGISSKRISIEGNGEIGGKKLIPDFEKRRVDVSFFKNGDPE